MPPPLWAVLAAAFAATFCILTISVMKKQTGKNVFWSRIYSGILSGVAAAYFGSALVSLWLYKPGHTYSYRSSINEIVWMHIIAQWALIALALTNAFQNYGKLTLKLPTLEIFTQGMACSYLFAVTCNEMAALAHSGSSQRDLLQVGEFIFAITTITVLLAASGYLAKWTEIQSTSPRRKRAKNVDLVKQVKSK